MSTLVHSFSTPSVTTLTPSATVPLLHRVDKAIRTSPHLIGRHLVLEASNGAVVLRGIVDSYFEKQMAQEALRMVEGITEIRNHLEVCYQGKLAEK